MWTATNLRRPWPAGLGRLPLPRVYGDACLSSQRPPRTFLNDVHRCCVSQNLDPVLYFSSFLDGRPRSEWADREEVWAQTDNTLTWSKLINEFVAYVGVDPLDRRDCAFRELFSDALHQRPTESVRDFTQRFTSALARLPPDSLDEAARIATYISHLRHQYQVFSTTIAVSVAHPS
jgi:hypothetical protein